MKKKQYNIGIDLGGTKISAVLWDGEKVLVNNLLATPKDDLEHLIIMMLELIAPLIARAQADRVEIKGIGLGSAGAIDYRLKKIINSPNISYLNGVNLGTKLSLKTRLSVILDNDVHCFLRAEMKLGATSRFNNVFGVMVGTGIGGASWQNQEIYQGSSGIAGEIGHVIVDYNSKRDLEMTYHDLMNHNSLELAKKAYLGNVQAQKVFEEFGEYLGLALINVVNILDPEAIVVGGGFYNSSKIFLDQAKQMVEKYCFIKGKKIKIVSGKIGDYAGAIGAALLVD